MYITPRQKKRYIIGSVIAALSIPITLAAIYAGTQLISRASGTDTPTSIAISNLSSRSLTLTWVTEDAVSGAVRVVGDSEATFEDPRSGVRFTHYVELVDLAPDTEYDFVIISNDKEFQAEGSTSFRFKTLPINGSSLPVPNPVFGSIGDQTDDDLLVFAFTPDTFPIASVPNTGGNWNLQLDSLVDRDALELINLTATTQLTIAVQGRDGLGVVVTGPYSELFDDSGKIVDAAALVPSEVMDIAALLPEGSGVGDVIAVTPPPTTGGSTGETPPPAPTTGGGTGVVTPPPIVGSTDGSVTPPVDNLDFDPADRVFRLTADLQWVDLITAGSTDVGTPNVVTGPDTVKITNLTDTGFSVTWMSPDKVTGSVSYGTAADALSSTANDVRDGLASQESFYTHIVEVTGLTPSTPYFFTITSGSNTIDDGGAPFEVTTYGTLAGAPPFDTIEGVVTGAPDPTDVVVIVQIGDLDSTGTSGLSNFVSVVPGSSGSWIASVGDVRNQTGDVYYEITDGDEINVELLVYADSDPISVTALGYKENSFDIAVSAPTQGSGYQRVPLLGSYGIIGGSDANAVGGSGTGVPDGTTTPKTSLSRPMVIGTSVGIAVVSIGGMMLVWDRRRHTPSRLTKGSSMLSRI